MPLNYGLDLEVNSSMVKFYIESKSVLTITSF